MSRITLGDAENILIPGKNMGKKNMFLPPGKIANEYFEYEISNIGSSLLQEFISGKPVKKELTVFRIKKS
jgi:hypothetical protein